MAGNHHQNRNGPEAVQLRAVERRQYEAGCSRDEARAYVEQNYIGIGAQYWISPEAVPEIDAAIQERLPHSAPLDRPPGGQRGSPGR